MGSKKKKLASAKAKATIAAKASRRGTNKDERHASKLDRRKLEGRKQKKTYTAEMWAVPAPSHLVAKLDVPRVKSKYQSYFEFAENTEKKDKKLEYKVTDEAAPPPGFAFVPIGDPALTNACKELSRERDAMIFIVSGHKEENSKISEHIYRTGYHFREVIVDEAREIVGETIISNPAITPGLIEPIPESQDEINKQADGAIRDLFPRIPNTDRQMIIEHAFKKGALFHGEPTVGLQSNIPLSRRVQLAVLAHIRHTHTRYDKLLRETTWMNARKVVEPVCLDVLVKWRGDEETGRDQMDEILREVVIITDSEDEDDSSEEDSSDEEGEVTSDSSPEAPSLPGSQNQPRAAQPQNLARPGSQLGQSARDEPVPRPAAFLRPRPKVKPKDQRDKKAQRGFKRYQAAWDEAKNRQQQPSSASSRAHGGTPVNGPITKEPPSAVASPVHNTAQPLVPGPLKTRPYMEYTSDGQRPRHLDSMSMTRPDPYYSQPRPAPVTLPYREEVLVRPLSERPIYYQDAPPRLGTPSYLSRDQRPPQVVRGSPTKHGLQDMLVPSIETTSSDVTAPRLGERHGVHNSWEKDSYPRRVIEHQRQSPPPRQVIVINDDSPQIKRRRLVHEDGSGRFRSFPSRDQSYMPVQPDSSLISASSVPKGNFLARPPRVPSHPAQGLFKDNQPSSTAPGATDRLPVYDAPESGFFTTHPSHLGRQDIGYSGGYGGESHIIRQLGSPKPREKVSESVYHRKPVHDGERENLRIVEHTRGFQPPEYAHRDQFQRPSSPNFPVSNSVSRSYDTGPGSVVADQDFIHSFSQSRLDGPSLRTRDGFTVAPERSRQHFVSQSDAPQRYEDHSTRTFAAIPVSRARSPVRYMERPMSYREGSRQPVFYDQQPPERYAPIERSGTILRELRPLPPHGDGPTYVRPAEPRRQIIVLE